MSEELYELKSTGERFREVRKTLKMPLSRIAGEAGISRSIISEMENGKRGPNPRYMIYLVVKRNVDLRYVFKGEGEMFLTQKSAPSTDLDFRESQKAVDEMIYIMHISPEIMYSLLAVFAGLKREKRELLEEILGQS